MEQSEKLYIKPKAASTVVQPFVAMSGRDLLRAMVTGAIVGLFGMGLFLVLNKFIFSAALCRDGVTGCSNAPIYSTVVTVVVLAIVGIIVLARVGIYRPLLVALVAPLALWGAFTLATSMAWGWALVMGLVLFALAYGTFAWVARLRSFIASILLLVVLVVIFRLILP